MNKTTALIVILSVALLISLAIIHIQHLIYEQNLDSYHEQYMDLLDYCQQLEDIVEEWEVWIP